MKRALMLGLMPSLLFGTVAACAQSVQVYSEFARLSEAGDPVAPAGHNEEPREILSPALPRNAFTSFQIAVQVPKDTKFHLYMGQNPADALKVIVYRRAGEKLEPVGLPYGGESSQVFWMDVWVDGTAPVRRVKLEPQVYVNGDWITYPMEVRVSEPVVPDILPLGNFVPLRGYLCNDQAGRRARDANEVTSKQERNERQDVALAAQGSAQLRESLKAAMGACDAKPPADPEFYLRLRDVFFAEPKKVQGKGSPR